MQETQGLNGLILLPIGIAAGWLAGAAAARRTLRKEMAGVRQAAIDAATAAVAAATPVAAAAVAPAPTPASKASPVVAPAPVPVPAAAPAVPEETEPSEETILILSAVVAAVLGKKARIRAARLVSGSQVWAQQGRASIQASHNLGFSRHGR